MSQSIISKFQAYFPPIYKEDKGLNYGFSVFIKRLKLLFGISVIFAVLFSMYNFIFPNSIPELKDWYGSLGRILIVCLVLWMAYKAMVYINRLNKGLEELKTRQSFENEENLMEIAELFGAATAASIALSTFQEKNAPHEDILLIRKLAVEIEKRNKTQQPVFSSEKKERDANVEAFKQAIKLKRLFSYSGYKLYYSTEILKNPSDKVIQSIVTNLRTLMSNSSKDQQIFLSVFSPELAMNIPGDVEEKSNQELETEILNTIEWLNSIQIGLRRSEFLNEDVVFFSTGNKSKFKLL